MLTAKVSNNAARNLVGELISGRGNYHGSGLPPFFGFTDIRAEDAAGLPRTSKDRIVDPERDGTFRKVKLMEGVEKVVQKERKLSIVDRPNRAKVEREVSVW